MKRKFYGVKLGRSDFEEIEYTLKQNCDDLTVRVDNLVADSLFSNSLHSKVNDFTEIIFFSRINGFSLQINERFIIVECKELYPKSRGIYESICDVLRNRQLFISSTWYDYKFVWFRFDTLMLFAMELFIPILWPQNIFPLL